MSDSFLELTDVRTHFPIQEGFLFKHAAGTVKAVDGVNLAIKRGEVLGLVGEAGCGKSTLARTIMQLIPPTAGTVILGGKNLTQGSTGEIKAGRPRTEIQLLNFTPWRDR